MDKKQFATLLLTWYEENKRALPWRKTKNPYKIWLSEVLLQQTRVAQGLPYYLRFVKRFPTVESLASAPEKEILRLWQGLGYYSRARNLHRCSKAILALGGKFPKTVTDLKRLPGIGDYTAAAIASLAFNQPAAVVDGNVFRVLGRLFGIELDIASPPGKKYFFELANTLIPADNPGSFNQAMMEFGAIHCTPKKPKCSQCIFSRSCLAFQTESQSVFPFKTKLKKRKRRYFNYLVVRSRKKIWMQSRKAKDIWEGLHEFYLWESNRLLNDSKIISQFQESLGLSSDDISAKSIRMNQLLSHQEIIGKFFEWEFKAGNQKPRQGKFYSLNEIENIAKPVLINNYLKKRAHGLKPEKK